MYDFGLTLKKYRNAKKLTMKTLSGKIGVTEGTISRYENNLISPTLETLRALSGILGVSLDELCGTETRGTASLYGLTDEQAAITKDLITAFRNHNEAFKKQITSEHYELLGKITAEFSK